MATEIGPGTRVWCGWAPDHQCWEGTKWACARTGTIMRLRADGIAAIAAIAGVKYWDVHIDGAREISVREDLLYPIDDGDPHETDDTTERPRVLEREES